MILRNYVPPIRRTPAGFSGIDPGAIAAVIKDPRSSIESIVIQTAFGPDVVIDYPFVEKDPNAPETFGDKIARRLKPKVTVNVKGYGPLEMAPYGDPGPTKWPTIKWIGAGAAALGVFLVGRSLLR